MLLCIAGNDDLITSLLFDAEATRGVVSNWMKENSDENESASRRLALLYHFTHCTHYISDIFHSKPFMPFTFFMEHMLHLIGRMVQPMLCLETCALSGAVDVVL